MLNISQSVWNVVAKMPTRHSFLLPLLQADDSNIDTMEDEFMVWIENLVEDLLPEFENVGRIVRESALFFLENQAISLYLEGRSNMIDILPSITDANAAAYLGRGEVLYPNEIEMEAAEGILKFLYEGKLTPPKEMLERWNAIIRDQEDSKSVNGEQDDYVRSNIVENFFLNTEGRLEDSKCLNSIPAITPSNYKTLLGSDVAYLIDYRIVHDLVDFSFKYLSKKDYQKRPLSECLFDELGENLRDYFFLNSKEQVKEWITYILDSEYEFQNKKKTIREWEKRVHKAIKEVTRQMAYEQRMKDSEARRKEIDAKIANDKIELAKARGSQRIVTTFKIKNKI